VLGVMRARDLDHALELQNASEFGLTGGLHSLDPDEIEEWSERVAVGNAYVNRHTTGAIVRRQPFGGWKHSAVGPGAKTGGPDDLLRFVRPTATRPVDTASYEHWWATMYRDARDASGLRAERNELRHRPLDTVSVLPGPDSDLTVLEKAAACTGTRLDVIGPDDRPRGQRLRALTPVPDALARVCHAANIAIDDTPVTGHGRVEIPRWVREQAISRTLHRHGRTPN
jgi:RHH-type proline utilization regulon transcriptional repressor/proline dehydrogenase/delta 1-pyrroline-5-carboxylate dehydrogenase